MNNKDLVIGLLFALVVIFAGTTGYFAFVKNSSTPTNQVQPITNIRLQETPSVTTKDTSTPSIVTIAGTATPTLSADKKSISDDKKILLAIDNDVIFDWFKTKSQLCDENNIMTNSGRKTFCEDKVSFKNQTRFASIVVSPDKMKIGFTIESDTLSPDAVVGIFSLSNNTVNLFGSYYLGNKFISFSPNSINFVYQSACFEGMCGLYVKNSETLADVIELSDSESADARTRTATFVKWLSDNEVEYKLGEELKRASF